MTSTATYPYLTPLECETHNEFIQRIIDSRNKQRDKENYQEEHHIKPKCEGGNNEKTNLVYLYAEEHYYAHKLLAIENPNNLGLQNAWWNMCQCTRNGRFYTLDAEEFGEARRRSAAANSIRMNEYYLTHDGPNLGAQFTDEHCEKISKALTGIVRSEETRKKVSENHADVSGEKNPMYGKHHTHEVCERLRQANLGKTLTQEQKDKISKAQKGKIVSEETRKKMSQNNARLKGAEHPQSKKVQCIETGDIFDCSREAGLWAGLSGKNPGTSITKQILHPDKCKYAGHHPETHEPLTWRYFIE